MAGNTDAGEIIDVGGGVLNSDEVVREVRQLITFVELAGVVRGDSGIHD